MTIPNNYIELITNNYAANDNKIFLGAVEPRYSFVSWVLHSHKISKETDFPILGPIETGFLNPLGYYPLLGAIMGCLRLILSSFELFVSVLLLLGSPLVGIWAADIRISGVFLLISLNCMINTFANLIRGYVEIIPGGGLVAKYAWDKQNIRIPCC